jgi:hypothetical protein
MHSRLKDIAVRLSESRYSAVVILAAGLVARLPVAFFLGLHNDLQRFEMELSAISLAQTGTLGNVYAIPTGPSAHIAPGYAAVLAVIFFLFGTGTTADIVKVIVCTAFSVATYALFPRLTHVLGYGKRLGFWFGLGAALLPTKPLVDLLGDWEAPLVLCTIGIVQVWRSGRLTTSAAIRQGIIWGCTLLISPAFLTLFGAFVIAGFALRSERRMYFRFAAVQVAVVASFLAPWAVRNYIQLGSPVVMRSNTGLELYISNNDDAGPDEKANSSAGIYERYHPYKSIREAERVKALGEVTYNATLRNIAFEWIRHNPERFVTLCIQRARLYWFPAIRSSRVLVFCTLSVASFAGVMLLLRRDLRAGAALLLPILILPLPHYLVHVNVRHKYPTDWIGVVGAALVFCHVVSYIRAKRSAPGRCEPYAMHI